MILGYKILGHKILGIIGFLRILRPLDALDRVSPLMKIMIMPEMSCGV